MPHRRTKALRRLLPVLAVLTLAAAACTGGKGDGVTPSSATSGPRPSSPATVSITSPTNGEQFKAGTTIPVAVKLTGARIVKRSTLHITPTTGHLHLYVDNAIVSMNYSTTNSLKDVKPGVHEMRVEFVAADHRPFDPPVIATVAFEVTG
jgi:Family of unknown function (DUF6130)